MRAEWEGSTDSAEIAESQHLARGECQSEREQLVLEIENDGGEGRRVHTQAGVCQVSSHRAGGQISHRWPYPPCLSDKLKK